MSRREPYDVDDAVVALQSIDESVEILVAQAERIATSLETIARVADQYADAFLQRGEWQQRDGYRVWVPADTPPDNRQRIEPEPGPATKVAPAPAWHWRCPVCFGLNTAEQERCASGCASTRPVW